MTNDTHVSTSLELVREAHERYSTLSIETKLVKVGDVGDYYTGMAALVKTPKGNFSAWAMGDVDDVLSLEEQAVTKALMRAGIGISPRPSLPSPPQPTTHTRAPLTEKGPTNFTPVDTSEPSTTENGAETALLCEGCGQSIEDYEAGSAHMSAAELAQKTRDRYERALCANCAVKQQRTRRSSKKTT